jgi:penicillin-binding protein 2
LKNQEPTVKNQDLLDEKSVNLIREGMVGSCNPGGEAWPLYGFKVKNAKLKVDGKNILSVASASADMRQITIACKTGSAEAGGPSAEPHAWITLFAPAYKPQIVVTILSENSGMGSNVAAPIAKQILENWFER